MDLDIIRIGLLLSSRIALMVIRMPEHDAEKALRDDPLFSGRGSAALISTKEPALKLLRETYSESFALTRSNEKQVHLFLIKVGLWSLVWTFTPRDFGSDIIEIGQVLDRIEEKLENGDSEFRKNLDTAVKQAIMRIGRKVDAFSDKSKLR